MCDVTVHDIIVLHAELALGLANPAASGSVRVGYILRGPVKLGLLLHALLRFVVLLLLLVLGLLLLVLVVLMRLASPGGRRARVVCRFVLVGRTGGLRLTVYNQFS